MFFWQVTLSVQKPYGLNLNYDINLDTEIFLPNGTAHTTINGPNRPLHKVSLIGKSLKFHKTKEFKSIEIRADYKTDMAGLPILNTNNEVIGIIVRGSETQSDNTSNSRNYQISILDSDLWKKM